MPSDTPCPRRSTLLTLGVLASLGLAGCGLGGHIDVQPRELHFEAVQGEAPPPSQLVKATSVEEQVVAGAPKGEQLPSWLSTALAAGGEESFSFRLQIADTRLAVGTYSTVVRFVTGVDRQFAEVQVRYTVLDPATHPPIVVAPNRLEFTAHTGQRDLPEARSVTVITPRGQAVGYALSASYSDGGQDWLELPSPGMAPQAVSLRPRTTALPPGTYTSVVDVTPDSGWPAFPLTVVYTVLEPGLETPHAFSLRFDTRTTDAELTFPEGRIAFDVALDWRLVSNSASWLEASLVPGSTQEPPRLRLRAIKSALASLDNGTYVATITLAYRGAQVAERQVAVPVTLTVDLPRVRTVMPYATEAGRSLSHILRGSGFSGLRSGQRLHIGPATTSAYQVVSDTELRLDVPALPVGAHAIWVDNALGLATSGATLHAVRTPAFSEFSIARERVSHQLVYDPLRLAVYSLEHTLPYARIGLYRYQYASGTWQEEEFLPLSGLSDVRMDVDGQSLYLAIGAGLYQLSLEDATATPRFVRTIPQRAELAVLNDGYVLVSSSSNDCTYVVTSLDGRRAVLVTPMGCTSSMVQVFDASSRSLWQGPVPLSEWLTIDRTARLATDGIAVYDEQWSLVAGLEVGLDGLSFSPDSRRLFGFYADYARSREVLYVYDVSSPPVRGRFVRLAEIPMPGVDQYAAYGTRGFVTPDGRTLIKVDHDRFHVYPIPGWVQ